MKNNLQLRVIGLITFFMMMVVMANAQAKFGFRLGANLSRQEAKQDSLIIEPKSKFGLDLAFVADFPLGEVISFAPELHWLQKGYEIEDIGTEGTATLNYLELPLLIKFNFGETSKFGVFGGPSVGYLLGGKVILNGVEQEDFFEFVNRIELGAHLGAAITVGPVQFDVRYILGISNISDVPDVEIRNTAFGAGVAIMF